MSQQIAVLGSGCFWCTEAVFRDVKGVTDVVSGYTGGARPNPTYEEVCMGTTGHTEVVQVTFDATQISYKEILEIFFGTHDPTTLNRQGHDVGTQYRSVIFYTDEEQKHIAEETIAELAQQDVFSDPIVTSLEPLTTFYPAESYHQRYFENHPDAAYCQAIISPKVAKFRKRFADKLKT